MKKYKLLLVDDSLNDRILLRDIIINITDINFEIQQTPTLEEALTQLDLYEPDVILLDYWLDGANGFDLFKKHPQLKDSGIPIVLCTGGADLRVVDEAKEYGVRSIVSKDALTVNLLSTRLKDAISNRPLKKN